MMRTAKWLNKAQEYKCKYFETSKFIYHNRSNHFVPKCLIFFSLLANGFLLCNRENCVENMSDRRHDITLESINAVQ